MGKEPMIDQIYQASQEIIKKMKDTPAQDYKLEFREEFKLKSSIDLTYGKWPIFYGSVAMIDYKGFQRMVKIKLSSALNELFESSNL